MNRTQLPFSTAPYMFFLLLFPGTILYYVATTNGLIPALITGYFGKMSAAALALLAPIYLWVTLRTGRIAVIDLAYFSFLLFFLCVVIFNKGNSEDNYIFTWHIVSIAQCAAVFLICKGIFRVNCLPGIALKTLWIASSACILIFTVDGRFSLRELPSDVDKIPGYQTFALCYLLLSVIFIAGVRSLPTRCIAHAVAIACLYINGARSEFVAYVLFAATYEFLSSKNKGLPIFALIIVTAGSVAAISSGIVEIPDSRVANLLDLQHDNSSNERSRIASEGLNKIMESPILGNYGKYEKGEYIHNILSAWNDLGLFGFLFILIISIGPAAKLGINIALGRAQTNREISAFSILAVTIVLLLVGKYFTYLLLPAALGLYSSSNLKIEDN
ncbi:TPA: O-antigen ligase domain-containing protein [Pseudomonas aeruginosa]|nr:O-antigen ligase domain-containing protein [Pseudomonas aeruginosa]HCE6792203.1 O-antigen ligase domain-containing protein [Pseudomonas aeruginosa]HCK4391736.1 O-antigen ligase domain-containing protein [Pseudomonas aeruginosa]